MLEVETGCEFKLVVAYVVVDDSLEKEGVLVPMVGSVVGVVGDGIAFELDSVYGLGVEYGFVEGLYAVVSYGDAAVEVFLLLVEIGYLGIDGDDGVGELEAVGEGVDYFVFLDEDIAACSGLVPTVAVSAEEYGAATGVVKGVVADDDLAWCAEERSASAVVAYGIACELYAWTPCEVFDAVGCSERIDVFCDWVCESYTELSDAFVYLAFVWGDAAYGVGGRDNLHGVGLYELDCVAGLAPTESVALAVHVLTYEGVVVDALDYLEIGAVYVDGVVHHAFEEAVALTYDALAA